mgnify:CR=1 FL=1
MTNFKNGQAVICPSISTKLLYAYHCKTTNGMWVVDKKAPLSYQYRRGRWYNLSGYRQEVYMPTKDVSIGSRFSTPKVFPATAENIKALNMLGFYIDVEAIEEELAEKWTIGTIVTEVRSLHVEGCEKIENDVVYRFIDEDTIEFVGPNGDLYTTHYKSLKV